MLSRREAKHRASPALEPKTESPNKTQKYEGGWWYETNSRKTQIKSYKNTSWRGEESEEITIAKAMKGVDEELLIQ
jgi:hypothetical protein